MTEQAITELENLLGVVFVNKEILNEALRHRSYLNESNQKNLYSNERLEFLGDSILSFWVSDQIFRKFPEFPEGKLTFIRTHLVRTTTLTELARNLNFGKFLLMSRGEEQGGGKENPTLLANCFEAVLGAIFYDQGIEVASKFLEKMFSQLIEKVNNPDLLKDSKSLLQESVQSKGSGSPLYRLISSEGPDHKKTFTMGVFIDEKLIAEGTSKSKQEAEEIAATKALEILH